MDHEILKTKAELIAIQYMVANLYASMFGERFGVEAAPAAKQFADSLRDHIRSWTIPGLDRKSTRLNSSHIPLSRMPSSA